MSRTRVRAPAFAARTRLVGPQGETKLAVSVRTELPTTLQSVTTSDPDRARFTALFEDLSPRVYGYARRRCDPIEAQDVVSDVFLVAWRRWSDVPPDALPWLLTVARNTIANRQRGERRARITTEVLTTLNRIARHATAADSEVIGREQVLAALAELTDLEREAVLLVAWDGLTNSQACRVAGCSQRAFEVRLSRARARLSRALPSAGPTASRNPTCASNWRRS